MKKVIGAVAVAAVVVGVTSYFSPYLTLYQMKGAIEKRDAEAFSEHVDFPALRESIKGQLMAVINQRMDSSSEPKDGPFAGAGKAMAAAFITPIIDAAVTPAGVIGMMKSGDVKPRAKGGADAGPADEKKLDFSVSHEGWSKVVVRKAGDSDGGFVFKRDGLWSWKLAGVEMPKSAFGPAK